MCASSRGSASCRTWSGGRRDGRAIPVGAEPGVAGTASRWHRGRRRLSLRGRYSGGAVRLSRVRNVVLLGLRDAAGIGRVLSLLRDDVARRDHGVAARVVRTLLTLSSSLVLPSPVPRLPRQPGQQRQIASSLVLGRLPEAAVGSWLGPQYKKLEGLGGRDRVRRCGTRHRLSLGLLGRAFRLRVHWRHLVLGRPCRSRCR